MCVVTHPIPGDLLPWSGDGCRGDVGSTLIWTTEGKWVEVVKIIKNGTSTWTPEDDLREGDLQKRGCFDYSIRKGREWVDVVTVVRNNVKIQIAEGDLQEGDLKYANNDYIWKGEEWVKTIKVRRGGEFVYVAEEDLLEGDRKYTRDGFRIWKGEEWVKTIKVMRDGTSTWIPEGDLRDGDLDRFRIWNGREWVEAIKVIRNGVETWIAKGEEQEGDVGSYLYVQKIWQRGRWVTTHEKNMKGEWKLVECRGSIASDSALLGMTVNLQERGRYSPYVQEIWEGGRWVKPHVRDTEFEWEPIGEEVLESQSDGKCPSSATVSGSASIKGSLLGMTVASVTTNLDAMELESKVLTLEKFNALAPASGKHYVVVDSDVYVDTPDGRTLSKLPNVKVVHTGAQGHTNSCADNALLCAASSGKCAHVLQVEGQSGPHLVTVIECDSPEQATDVVHHVQSGACDIPDAGDDAWNRYKEFMLSGGVFTTARGYGELTTEGGDHVKLDVVETKNLNTGEHTVDITPATTLFLSVGQGSSDMPFGIPKRWSDPKGDPDDFGGGGNSGSSSIYEKMPGDFDSGGVPMSGNYSNKAETYNGGVTA